MEEGTAFGTPAFRVRKKFIARLREVLTRAEPETFFFTEHYAGYPEYLHQIDRGLPRGGMARRGDASSLELRVFQGPVLP